jgi:hypothetical protein
MEIAIPNQVKELSLGEVFSYILSDEWGISPELPIEAKNIAIDNNCSNVHYQNANEDEKTQGIYLDGGFDSGDPETK